MKKITLYARLRKPWESRTRAFSLETYTDRLAESGRNILRESYEGTRRLNHNQLNPEHAVKVFKKLGIERDTVIGEMNRLAKQRE